MPSDAQKKELIDKTTRLVNMRFGGDFERAFRHYDSNQDGRINRDELSNLLSDANVGGWLTRGAWVRGVIDALDKDADAAISAAEFQSAMK